MTDRMQALVWREDSGLAMDEVETPSPRPDEDLVRVAFCGVCGTDLHILDGSLGFSPARIMGHEMVGVTEDGRRVFVNPNGECGACSACRNGQPHFCRLAWTGDGLGIVRDGGWAQLLAAPRQRILSLPNDIPLSQCALSEPLACVVRGFDRLPDLRSGHDILVVGCGIIGILWIVSLHFKGFRRLSAVEMSDRRASMVRELGLGVAVMSPAEMTSLERRYDVVIDCSGNPRAFEASVGKLRPAGTYLVFGCAGKGQKGRVDVCELVLNQWKIQGSRMNPYTNAEGVALMAELSRAGMLDFKKIGVGVFPLGEFEKALKALKENEYTKIIFEIPK